MYAEWDEEDMFASYDVPAIAAASAPRPRPYRLPRRMRFFEFEAREVVKRAGIPVTDYGFTTDPAQARQIAGGSGGPS